jgi:transposase
MGSTTKSVSLLERRRIGVQMLLDGVRQAEVARRLHVSQQSVSRWKRAFEAQGWEGIAAKPHRGPRQRMSARDRKKLSLILLRGALAYGFGTDLWTRRRIADVIRREFGVRYHTDHISRVMMGIGWSCQKPAKRANERSEAGIVAWLRRDWNRIKKKPGGKAPRSASSTKRAYRKSRLFDGPGHPSA